MPGRLHQNDAPSLTLSSGINAGDTTIPVSESISGVETPISYTINSGGANEEIVTLTTKNTSTSPSQFEDVVRGCDGTADQSHSSGEVLTHEATARDLVDRRPLYAQTEIPPDENLVLYEDFRDISSLPPYMTVRKDDGGSGSVGVAGNTLKLTAGSGGNNSTFVTIDKQFRHPYRFIANVEGSNSSSGGYGMLFDYEDSSNFFIAKITKNNDTGIIQRNNGGTFSTVDSHQAWPASGTRMDRLEMHTGFRYQQKNFRAALYNNFEDSLLAKRDASQPFESNIGFMVEGYETLHVISFAVYESSYIAQ
jgi:hypothetical protein